LSYRYNFAVRVEPNNALLCCRFGAFLYQTLEDVEGAKQLYSAAWNLGMDDPRVNLHLNTFDQFLKQLESNANASLLSKTAVVDVRGSAIVTGSASRGNDAKALRKKNVGALSLTELASGPQEKKLIIDPTLEIHRKLIDDLCFSFVCKSAPFRIVENSSIGKLRDARTVIHGVLKGARAQLQFQQNKNAGEVSTCSRHQSICLSPCPAYEYLIISVSF